MTGSEALDDCRACRGSGMNPGGDDCEVCSGRGCITVPTDPTPREAEPTPDEWRIAEDIAGHPHSQRADKRHCAECKRRDRIAHALAAHRASVSAEHEKREREALQHIAALLKGADEYDGEPWMERARAFLARTKGADDGE